MLYVKKLARLLALLALIGVPLWFAFAALGSKFGLIDWKLGLGKMTFQWGKYVLFTGAGIGAAALLMAVLFKPRSKRAMVTAALALAFPVIGMGYANSVRKSAATLPFIHDITTDTQNPPMFTQAILSQRGQGTNPTDYIGKKDPRGTELVSVLQAASYKDIRPLILSDDPSVVFGRAQSAVKASGMTLVSENLEAGLIEATETTFWFGFKDDVIIRITPSEGGGSVVDLRSLSRVGGSDLGANAARIRRLSKLIEAK